MQGRIRTLLNLIQQFNAADEKGRLKLGEQINRNLTFLDKESKENLQDEIKQFNTIYTQLEKQVAQVDAVSDILSGRIGSVPDVDESEVNQLLQQVAPHDTSEEDEINLEQQLEETLKEEEAELQIELENLEEEIAKEERSAKFKHVHVDVPTKSLATSKPSENNLLTQAQALQEKAKELTDHQTKKMDHLVGQHKSRADALKDVETRKALEQPTFLRRLAAGIYEKCTQFINKVKSFLGIKNHTESLAKEIHSMQGTIQTLQRNIASVEKSLQDSKKNPNQNLIRSQKKQLAVWKNQLPMCEKLKSALEERLQKQQLPTLKRK